MKSSRPDLRPSFQFYPDDWMSETALRVCSLSVRGLFIDMMCLMFKSPRRGYLVAPSGSPLTAADIAKVVGEDSVDVEQMLNRLESVGAFSRDGSGAIYSRRMVREEEQRLNKVSAGIASGASRRANRGHTEQRTEREQEGGSSSPASTSAPHSIPLKVAEELCRAEMLEYEPTATQEEGVHAARLLQAALAKQFPRSRPTATITDADGMRFVASRLGPGQLADLINWAAQDPHWGPVLLSRGGPGRKFREHLDAIVAKWEAGRRQKLNPQEQAAKEELRRQGEEWRRKARQAPQEPGSGPRDLEAARDAISGVLNGLTRKGTTDGEKAE